MTTKTASVQIKRSGTAAAVPTGLLGGELAINVADKKLFSSDGSATFQVAPSMTEHNAKEPSITAGTASQFWRGDKSWQDIASAVRAAVLTGFSTASSAVVTATDSVLVALGKLQAQVSLRAPIDSPTFTGTPTVPTATIGTNNTQAASTAFVQATVDAARQGLSVKDAAKVRSSANITVSSPGTTVDGVTMSAGDRVLLTAQTTTSQNGLWVWNGSAVAMTRPLDFDASADVANGAFIFVEEGTSADSGWVLTTDGAITIGTTALAFAQFSGAGQITAGTNITKSGNTLSLSTSPALSGTPTTPTAVVGTNTTQVASTAFVQAALDDITVIDGGTY